jgi:protein-serine/threonine kinase
MSPDGEAADELQSLSFGSSERSTATASCSSTSDSGTITPPPQPPPRGDTTGPTSPVPRLGAVALSDIRFLRRLGAGDIGSVYLAEVRRGDDDERRALLVAAKVMDRRELAARGKEARARTEREVLEAVDHPFLPRLCGVAEGARWSCLLTDFCPGGDLHVLRQRQPNRRFPEAAVRCVDRLSCVP